MIRLRREDGAVSRALTTFFLTPKLIQSQLNCNCAHDALPTGFPAPLPNAEYVHISRHGTRPNTTFVPNHCTWQSAQWRASGGGGNAEEGRGQFAALVWGVWRWAFHIISSESSSSSSSSPAAINLGVCNHERSHCGMSTAAVFGRRP